MACLALVVGTTAGVSASPLPAGSLNANFDDGKGTLSGYFQTTTSSGLSWDLQTSEFDCNPCGQSTGFPGFHYTPGNSTASLGFFVDTQSITFRPIAPTGFTLSFLIDCGGGGADCIGNAQDGDLLSISGFEMGWPDFEPFRKLSAATLLVTDPPGVVTFNVGPASHVPAPATLLLLLPALASLALFRRNVVRPV